RRTSSEEARMKKNSLSCGVRFVQHGENLDNEVTFKVTDGEMSPVPASHGQWGGYNTTRALAWVIRVAPNAWLARCGNQACGPSSFNKAKASALHMASGAHWRLLRQRSCSRAQRATEQS